MKDIMAMCALQGWCVRFAHTKKTFISQDAKWVCIIHSKPGGAMLEDRVAGTKEDALRLAYIGALRCLDRIDEIRRRNGKTN